MRLMACARVRVRECADNWGTGVGGGAKAQEATFSSTSPRLGGLDSAVLSASSDQGFCCEKMSCEEL
jgi:hypothetical protein